MIKTCVNCKFGKLKWTGMGDVILCMKSNKTRCLGEPVCEDWESDLGEEEEK